MADGKLGLFHKIIDLHSDEFAIGAAIKAIEEAVQADSHLAKFADITQALRALDRSHSISHARDLLAAVNKWSTNVNTGIGAACQALLALLGDIDAEKFVAWRLLFTWQHDRNISVETRNKLLVQALGWAQQSVGACSLTAMRLDSHGATNVVSMLGYNFIAEIKRTNLDASSFETIVDDRHDGRDAVINPGPNRYLDNPWNFDDTPSKLPGILCGRIAETIYSTGAESPLLNLCATVARIRARTGSTFEVLCDAVIADPADMVTCWNLVEALRFQKSMDVREEVEALIAAMAFAGDRQALLEAASFAVRRGYHNCDKSLLEFALGALAIASRTREITPVEPNENSVDIALSQAGVYLVKGLFTQAPASGRERVKNSLESFMASERAIGDERRADEEAERQAAAQTSAEDVDDVSDYDADPTPMQKYGHLLDSDDATAKPKGKLSSLQRRVAQIRAQAPEQLRVVHEIGNADISAPDTKRSLQRIAELMKPLPLAMMPTDLAAWRQGLVSEFPHAANAVDCIYGDLVSRQMSGKKGLVFRPTLLVGNPGCGKSRLARRVAESLKVGFKVFPCGGVSDGHFAGVSRGWTSCHPSVPIDTIRSSGIPNPIIILDEIEKSGSGRQNGNLLDTVLAMLEPETSKCWNDPFVQGACNLTAVNWIATANTLAGLPSPLLDRLRVVHVDSPDITHLPALSATILRELSSQHGHENWHQPLDQLELSAVGRAWSRQPSLRYLRRLIEGAIRAREMASARH